MIGAEILAQLREREKELVCIHHLSRVLTVLQPPEDLVPVVAETVRRALSDPETATVLVRYEGAEAQSQGGAAHRGGQTLAHCQPVDTSAGPVGELCISYLREGTPVILDHEREMLRTVAALLAEHGERRRVVEELRAAVAAENRKSVALEEVLTQVEELRRRNLADLRGTLEAEVLPLVARLEELSRPGPEKSLLEMLRDALSRLVQDSSTRNQAQRQTMRARLSPREYEIARMIAEGMPTKQIAETLNLARSTVERHRHGIRRKLGIRHERINLATFLRSDREE